MLEVSLDRAAYRPGDTARLRVVPRSPGTALITVLSNRLIAMETVEMGEEPVEVPLTVTDDWGAGAYVAVTLVRPMDTAAGRNPTRALGLAHAGDDPGSARLDVGFETAATARPRGPLDVALRVGGVSEGETAWVTIAAVDQGILNLTGHEGPDASGHYFGQRRLGMGLRDVYGRLIDGMTGQAGRLRSGGDAGAQMRTQAPPPTEELVAFFSGPVEVGADGLARVSFDLPSFNGKVKLMAVAWSDSGVGEAEAEVLVRDPVVLTATLPRFLAPGDTGRMLLELVHAEGPAGTVTLDVSAEGVALEGGGLPGAITLAENGRAALSVPVTAGQTGVASVRVAITTPGGARLEKRLALPVQVGDPEIARTSRFSLDAGARFTLTRDVFEGLRPGTGTATLALGPIARFDGAGLLRALDRYPYGCTEQVASQAMPLLYFEPVARALGLERSDTVDRRIAEAIDQVLSRQGSEGGFGLWQTFDGDFWLDAYVTDFLGRARAQGHDVPERAFGTALDNLRNGVNIAPDFDSESNGGGVALAYALMVLAREGAAAIGDLRYYADVKGDDFGTPLAAAQLGAALAFYGEQERADAMFGRAAAMLRSGPGEEEQAWRMDYGTGLRDAAAVLTLAAEAGSEAVDRDALAAMVAAPDRVRSTQEAAWTLLATHALTDGARQTGFTIDGAPATGAVVGILEDDTASGEIVFGNDTGRAAELTLTTFGVPLGPLQAGGNGYAITRSYYSLDGEAVDPARVAQGTRLVTVLTVTPFGDREARLMVTDPLPAGLEIENPNLLRSGDIRALGWLDPAEARHAEFRQDRFLAAVDWRQAEPFRLAYLVRAVSPGDYHHPAASVEDMYRPQFRANTASGRITVTE